jgi:hypothetical protein
MHLFHQMLTLLGPHPLTPGETGGARRLLLATSAFLAALVLVAVWGVAAGSTAGHFALVNAVSVPLLLLVSSVAALPASLLVFRLTSTDGRAADLVLGHAGAVFGASLVLALLAPFIALYQYSSSRTGPVVAMASVFLAIGIGLSLLLRVLTKLASDPRSRRGMLAPVGLLCALQATALWQLAAIAPPVMPHRTSLGYGVDALHASTSAERP